MHFTPFTILIGDNCVGKTSVLEAISFLKYCCTSTFDAFLNEYGLSISDIDSKLNRKRYIKFSTTFLFSGKEICWDLVISMSKDRLSLHREYVYARKNVPPPGKTDVAALEEKQEKTVLLSYTGSKIYSFRLNVQTKEKEPVIDGIFNNSLIKLCDLDKHAAIYPELTAIKRFFLNMEDLGLLSPNSMKRGSRGSSDSIGRSGKALSSFIKSLPPATREGLIRDVQKLVPKVAALTTKTDQYGRVRLESKEKTKNGMTKISSANISGGLLRIIAICSTKYLNNDSGSILLDELGDGINSDYLEQLVSLLKEIQISKDVQIITVTHNTSLLDCVSNDSLNPHIYSVVFMHNDENGKVSAKNILTSEVMQKQMEYMYPGEIVSHLSNDELKCHLGDIPADT